MPPEAAPRRSPSVDVADLALIALVVWTAVGVGRGALDSESTVVRLLGLAYVLLGVALVVRRLRRRR